MLSACLKLFNIRFVFTIIFVAFTFLPFRAVAAPVLNFSDITSGPKTGNTDGVGSGAIVTIWGNNLGSTQGTSKVYVGNVQATAIYYWKDADGALPGGPADLKTYHKMQEIAFSVPAGAVDGANTIKVVVGGVGSNTLPFTVRTGGIKFIKSTGSDTTGTGSWSAPYATLNNVFAGGNGKLVAGDIVYTVGVGSTSGIKVGGAATVAGNAANPIALIAYPNTRIALSGLGGDSSVIDNWYPSNRKNQYVNFSKLSVTSSGNDGDPSNGISVIPYNRIVGLEITGPTVYGGYGGAITGTAGVPQGGVYLGIYIHNYGYQSTIAGKNNYSYTYSDDANTWTSPPYNGIGDACTNCTSVDRFQHLFYISNRVTASAVAYEIGWNHLANNPILEGIHIYDMGDVGGWTGTLKVHHNVIRNQRGGAIDVSYPTASTLEIHDNLIIYDVGTKLQGIPFRMTAGSSPVKIYNNTIYGWPMSSYFEDGSDDFRNNIMVDTWGVDYVHSVGPPSTHSNNLFYSLKSTPLPSWYSAGAGDKNADPLFTNAAGYDFSLKSSSPALNVGFNTISVAPVDFFGQPRQPGFISIGAINVVDGGGVVLPPTPGNATSTSISPN